VLPAYAPVCVERGIVALALDSWCFGERRPYLDLQDGQRGEMDTFKEMLWNGACCSHDDVRRVAGPQLPVRPPRGGPQARRGLRISMGATKAWWLAALDERIRCCIDLCCLTDFEALLEARGAQRTRDLLLRAVAAAPLQDPRDQRADRAPAAAEPQRRSGHLTPPQGVQHIREHLYRLYAEHGRADDCRIELFDCGHQETPAMRQLVLGWIDKFLVGGR